MKPTALDTLTQHLQHDDASRVFSVAIGALVGFFAPIQAFLITVFMLVVADVITGIWASKHRGEPFRASKLKNTVGKMVLYPLAILISQIMVNTYFKDVTIFNSLSYMVALFISAVEFQSNIENIGDITGIDIWSQVKEFIQSRIKAKPKNQTS